jgi:uncharacterized membrane protein YcgQ (UPF0703/DUF1980 family)
MLGQQTLRILSGMFVITVSLSVGLWLFYRRILRARYLMYIYAPLSLTLSFLVVSIWSPILPTWGAKLVFSIIGATLIMIPALVILRLKGVDVDEWDHKTYK